MLNYVGVVSGEEIFLDVWDADSFGTDYVAEAIARKSKLQGTVIVVLFKLTIVKGQIVRKRAGEFAVSLDSSEVKEIPAQNVKGFFLYNAITDRYFFRVYGEKDENGRKKFKDYDICAEDIEVEVLAGGLSLYESEERNRLDWSSKYLSPANRNAIKNSEIVV